MLSRRLHVSYLDGLGGQLLLACKRWVGGKSYILKYQGAGCERQCDSVFDFFFFK